MSLFVASVALCVVSATMLGYTLWRQISYERRLSQMEQLVVRSVMEENPTLIDQILTTTERLAKSPLHMPYDRALAAARRLHGLEP